MLVCRMRAARSARPAAAHELVAAARRARATPCPIRGFAVGAAIRGASGPGLRRLQCRERRLPAGPVRRGQRDRHDGGGRRAGDRRGRRGRRRRGAVHALRRLPPAPGRVRAPGDQRASWRAGRAARRRRRWERCCRWRSGRSISAAAPRRARGRRARDPRARRRAGSRCVALVLGSGLGAIAERIAEPVVIDYARPAGLSAPERAGPCRPAGAGPARRRAGRLPAGPRPSLRGRRPAAAQHAGRARCKAHRLPRAAADQRLGLAAAGAGRRARWC